MNFTKTLLWLENFKNIKDFKLIEQNSKAKLDVKLKEGADGFVFPISVISVLYKKIYDDKSKFIISDEELSIRVKNYTIENSGHLLIRDFKAYIYESLKFNRKESYFYRLLCPIKSSFYIINLSFDRSNDLKLKLDKENLDVYITSSDNETYLVIESKSQLDYPIFIHYANSILFILGFLSGNLIKGEEFIFQTKDENWKECDGFFRRKLRKVSKGYQPITSTPSQYSNFISDKDYNYENKISYLNPKEISGLVNLVVQNGNYFVALKFLSEIQNLSFINRPSTLYVVLEIIVDEILKTKSKLFIEKDLIKQKSLIILSKYQSKLDGSDYDYLKDSLNEIDKKLTQNNKKYEEAFKILEIKLNVEDKKCLNKRNQFFHGRVIPNNIFIDSEEDYINLELEYYSLTQRLFTLISKLILKKVNYSGYVINHAKMREEQSGKSFNEEYFVNI